MISATSKIADDLMCAFVGKKTPPNKNKFKKKIHFMIVAVIKITITFIVPKIKTQQHSTQKKDIQTANTDKFC